MVKDDARNARKLEISRLLVFIAVCEEKSISAAARRLYLAQPAVTAAISKLEQALDVRLLERSHRGVKPTDSGKNLLDRAYEITRLAGMAVEEISGTARDPVGEVSVGLPSSSASILAVPLIERVSKRYPKIRLRLVESFSGYLWQWLEAGELDCALVFDQTSTAYIQSAAIAEEDIHLLGTPHRIGLGSTVSLKAAANHPIALSSRKHSIRGMLDEHFARHGLQLAVGLEIDAGQHLVRLIKSGQWCSLLAPCAVAEEVAQGILTTRRLTPPLTRKVCMARRRLTTGDAALEVVVEELLGMAQSMMADGVWQARWLG